MKRNKAKGGTKQKQLDKSVGSFKTSIKQRKKKQKQRHAPEAVKYPQKLALRKKPLFLYDGKAAGDKHGGEKNRDKGD